MIKVFMEGRVAVEAEVFEYGGKGRDVKTGVKFGLICNKFYGDEDPTFIMVTVFGRDENFAQYITMGNQMIVEGTLQSRRNDDGYTYYSVNASDVAFGAKKMSDSDGGNHRGHQDDSNEEGGRSSDRGNRGRWK